MAAEQGHPFAKVQLERIEGRAPSGIWLLNPDSGKRVQCVQPGSQEEAIGLLKQLPAPKDFGAWGALQAQYDSGRITLLEYCAKRYELTGFVRAVAEPDAPGAAGAGSTAAPNQGGR
jgi:hypothetical protein